MELPLSLWVFRNKRYLSPSPGPPGREKQITWDHFFNLVINVFNHKINERPAIK